MDNVAFTDPGIESTNDAPVDARVEVYGDASYGTAEILEHLAKNNAEPNVKVQPPVAPDGRYTKERFVIDLQAQTVECPNGVLVQIHTRSDGTGVARFGGSCVHCPHANDCTKSDDGRIINIHKSEGILKAERDRQKKPEWKSGYRRTRPKVERKIAHLMRRRHGGRRARVRGTIRVGHDFALLGAATNIARIAALGVRTENGTWTR